MIQDPHCEPCNQRGVYVFSNGEEMCRGYYDVIEAEIRKEISRDLRGEAFVARHEPLMLPIARVVQGLIADAYHRAARIAEEGLAHELTRELR